jgi:hypothetical protein
MRIKVGVEITQDRVRIYKLKFIYAHHLNARLACTEPEVFSHDMFGMPLAPHGYDSYGMDVTSQFVIRGNITGPGNTTKLI